MKIVNKIKGFFYDNPKRGVYIIMGVAFISFSINMIGIFRNISNNNYKQAEAFSEGVERSVNSVSNSMQEVDYMEGLDLRLNSREKELIQILEDLEDKGEENLTAKDSLLLEELQPELERLFEKLTN